MDVVAIVPAAGRGVRLGAEGPKALVSVLGESLLVRAIRGLQASGCVQHIVVAAPEGEVGTFESELAALPSVASSPTDRPAPVGYPSVHLVRGGSDRTNSVRRALAEAARVAPGAGGVLVHDAARAFTPVSVIQNVVRAVKQGASAVVPVLPVSDTVKQVDTSGEVRATVDRSHLRAVQTPQGFAFPVLREAYAVATDAATDDAGLVEQLGKPVTTVRGHAHALKITTAFDLAIAESVLANKL